MQTQMEDAAQLFLGTRMQCAQCHHHPFEKWSQKDYYSFSAFFSTVGRKPGRNPGEEVIYHTRKVAQTANKKDGGTVKAAGLGDTPLDLTADDDPSRAGGLAPRSRPISSSQPLVNALETLLQPRLGGAGR